MDTVPVYTITDLKNKGISGLLADIEKYGYVMLQVPRKAPLKITTFDLS